MDQGYLIALIRQHKVPQIRKAICLKSHLLSSMVLNHCNLIVMMRPTKSIIKSQETSPHTLLEQRIHLLSLRLTLPSLSICCHQEVLVDEIRGQLKRQAKLRARNLLECLCLEAS